ncbi:MAG: methyl-accepting chemotaxis protein [Bacillota bacterium]|nr:methyl-accepting chemotaxis protein [Bacillota bacterium]
MVRITNNLKIKSKIFLIISIFVLGFVSFQVYSMHSLSVVKVNGPLYKEIIQGKDVVADILPPPEYIIESYLLSFEMINETDQGYINKYIDESKKLEKDYYDRNKYWKENLPEGEIKKVLTVESYDYAVEFFNIRDKEFIPAIQNGDKQKATELLYGKMKDTYNLHRVKINEVVNMANENNEKIEQKASSDINRTTIVLIAFAAVIITLVVIFSSIISSAIAKPIVQVTNMLKNISEEQGDLTKRLQVTSRDEVGDMASYFNIFITDVHEIVKKVVKESSRLNNLFLVISERITELNGEIEAISIITEELSASTEETAAATEEISAATSEIRNDVNLFSTKAQEGASSAEIISSKATEVNNRAVVSEKSAHDIYANVNERLVEAIEKSQAINRITDTLNTVVQISAQTNVLALNASIEAARAGEHGAGFAVVAEQVRKLAQESKNAVLGIQDEVDIIVSSVESLVSSSKEILNFVDDRVLKDYEVLVDISKQYNKDAVYYNNLSLEISQKAEGLNNSVLNISKAIEGITSASNEGASGTSDIAGKTAYAESRSSEVVKDMQQAKKSVNNLTEMVAKFKI